MLVTSVYQEHGRAMRAYALRLRDTYIDDTAVDDIVQEALVRIWRHPEVLNNGKGSVRGWLFKTMRNIAGDWARARAVRPPEVRCPSNSDYSQYDPCPTGAVRDPADDVDAAIDTAALVLPALDRLTPAQRDAIERLYFLHQTPAQAAAELGDGVTPHAVKLRAHQALRALRAELTPPTAARGGSIAVTACEHDHSDLLAYRRGELDEATQRAVAQHLRDCPAAQAEYAELTDVHQMLSVSPEGKPLPTEFFLEGSPDTDRPGGDAVLQGALARIHAERAASQTPPSVGPGSPGTLPSVEQARYHPHNGHTPQDQPLLDQPWASATTTLPAPIPQQQPWPNPPAQKPAVGPDRDRGRSPTSPDAGAACPPWSPPRPPCSRSSPAPALSSGAPPPLGGDRRPDRATQAQPRRSSPSAPATSPLPRT